MDDTLQDKVIIVTGSSMNIGREIAVQSAALGANIIIADIDHERGEAVAGKINACGQVALFHKTDVSKEKEVDNLVKRVLNRFGRIDILINNAVYCSIQSLGDTSVDIWDRVIDTNFKGTYLCTKAVVPSMIKNRGGKVINITSGSVRGGRGTPFMSAYCGSKAGIVSFTHSIAAELRGSNIEVLVFFVSVCDTDITKKDLPVLAGKLSIPYDTLMEQIIPPTIGRLLKPEEVAHAIIYSLLHPETVKGCEVDDLDIYQLSSSH